MMNEPIITRVARFDSNDKYSIGCIYTEEEAKYTTWTRVSEWIEVCFEPIAKEVVIPQMVANLEKEITESERDHYIKIKKLRDRQQELMALSYTPEEAAMPGENFLDNAKQWG
jgi:hypothetical protein